MSRYVIKFSKEGAIRYISHLDLLRLFKRSFKRVGIKLQHTQGFNPHPKMSFAQPLSLGYSSIGEYLEFDTTEHDSCDEILERLASVMPEGVTVISCRELPAAGKSLAALIIAADYTVSIPSAPGYDGDLDAAVERYMAQERINVMKQQKKTGREIETDIRPMIKSLSGIVDDNNIILTMKLAAGSASNLSPEIVLRTFCDFAGIRFDRSEVVICRTGMDFASPDHSDHSC